MTTQPSTSRRVTVLDLAAARERARPLSMVTAYDWPTGRLADDAGVDCVLVGDSVARVVAGRSSTIPATLDQMIYHGEIVSRAVSRALVVVDLQNGFMREDVAHAWCPMAEHIVPQVNKLAAALRAGRVVPVTSGAVTYVPVVDRKPQDIHLVSTHATAIEIPVLANDQNLPRLSQRAGPLLGDAPQGLLIAGHGLYAWGPSLSQAIRHLEILEFLLEQSWRQLLLDALLTRPASGQVISHG
jgi:hypothetical protein